MTWSMFITDATGVVHRQPPRLLCAAQHVTARKVPVSAQQAYVYKLPGCRSCWEATQYDRIVGRAS